MHRCGTPNGIAEDGEECDDGDDINYNICTNACTLPTCGDGIISHSHGGLSSLPAGTIPDGEFFVFLEDCKNGGVDCKEFEHCEDGNTDPNDGCSPTCRIEYCGDGVKQDNEVCDWEIDDQWLHTDVSGIQTPIKFADCSNALITNGAAMPPILPNCIINTEHIPCDFVCNNAALCTMHTLQPANLFLNPCAPAGWIGLEAPECVPIAGIIPVHGSTCECDDTVAPCPGLCGSEGNGRCAAITPNTCTQLCVCDPDCVDGTVTMDVAKSCNAEFILKQFSVDVVINNIGIGQGVVTYSPGGAECPGDCSETFNAHTAVTLTPTPIGSSVFGGWSANCPGGVIADLTSDVTCTATLSSPQK